MNSNLHNFTRGALANRGVLTALTMEQLRARAPSAFATHEHESRSDRYAFIPTTRVIEALQDSGFVPVGATQSKSRLGRDEFTKHMLKFARMDGREMMRVGDSVPHVALVNSHDGTSAYNLIAGLYRLACSNGLMVADSFAQSVKVQHTGDIVGRVIEGSFQVIDAASKAGERAVEWQGIQLDEGEAHAYTRAAALLRWDGDKAPPIDPARLLHVRRPDDQGADLWRVFNRTQENLIGGGQRGRQANGRRMTVRPIAAIDGNVALNRALWELTEGMARLKAKAAA